MSEQELHNDGTGSEDTAQASADNTSGETTQTVTKEQPVADNSVIPEKFRGKTHEEVLKSAIEIEKLHTRTAEERNLLKKELNALKKQVESLRPAPAQNAPQGMTDEEMAKMLTKELKGENAGKVLLGLLAKVAEASKTQPQVDPDILEMKQERILEKQLANLNDPIAVRHKDDIRKIIVENELNLGHSQSVSFAWSKWKADNISSYLEESKAGTPSTGATAMETHQSGNAASSTPIKDDSPSLNNDENARVETFINYGIFKDKGDFKKSMKEIDSMKPSTWLKGGVTVGNPRE